MPDIKCNDNLPELRKMQAKSIDFVYIDPQFNTGKDQGDFDDRWASDDEYVEFMRPCLEEVHRVLRPDGALFLHVDYHASHYLKVMLDEIFGKDNFQREIIWKRMQNAKNQAVFGTVHDTILVYSKSKDFKMHSDEKIPYTGKQTSRFKSQDEHGRYYLESMKARGSQVYDGRNVFEWNGATGMWKASKNTLDDLDRQGAIVIKKNKEGQKIIYKKFYEGTETAVTGLWDDIPNENKPIYATQKPKKLLQRIILASSNAGDAVLDPFAGSGRTCEVTSELGRPSICIDNSPKACSLMEERFQ